MNNGGTVLIGLMLIVVAVMGYYNLEQQKTIELLNEEILEQARLRHNLIYKKHLLEQQIEQLRQDTIRLDEIVN